MFFPHQQLLKQLDLRMSNFYDKKIYGFNNASYSSKKITPHGKQLPVANDEIEIIVIRPVISRTFSPNDIQI